MHEEEGLRVDNQGAPTSADAAGYIQTVFLELSQLLALEVKHTVQPFEVLGDRSVLGQFGRENEVFPVRDEACLSRRGEGVGLRARVYDADFHKGLGHRVVVRRLKRGRLRCSLLQCYRSMRFKHLFDSRKRR